MACGTARNSSCGRPRAEMMEKSEGGDDGSQGGAQDIEGRPDEVSDTFA
jgi:hypothetical protein